MVCTYQFLAHSMSLYDRTASVRLSVCKLLRKSLLLAGKWPDRHQTCTRWTPGQRASRVCSRSRSRSKVTLYGHFCAGTKIASCREQMAGSPPNLHTMDSRSACIQDVLKVKVKGQRSRDTGTFVLARKSLVLSVTLLDRHQNLQPMVSRKAWPKFWVRLSRGNGYS